MWIFFVLLYGLIQENNNMIKYENQILKLMI